MRTRGDLPPRIYQMREKERWAFRFMGMVVTAYCSMHMKEARIVTVIFKVYFWCDKSWRFFIEKS